jgi:hypothetical protein
VAESSSPAAQSRHRAARPAMHSSGVPNGLIDGYSSCRYNSGMDGKVLYRVRWRDWHPYVAIGETYLVGKTKKQVRVRERNGEASQQPKHWHSSVRDAIDFAVSCEAFACSQTWLGRVNYDSSPERLIRAVSLLQRLRVKLRRHGIDA